MIGGAVIPSRLPTLYRQIMYNNDEWEAYRAGANLVKVTLPTVQWQFALSGKLCFKSLWPGTNVAWAGERMTTLDRQGEKGWAGNNRHCNRKYKVIKIIIKNITIHIFIYQHRPLAEWKGVLPSSPLTAGSNLGAGVVIWATGWN